MARPFTQIRKVTYSIACAERRVDHNSGGVSVKTEKASVAAMTLNALSVAVYKAPVPNIR